VGDRVCVGVFVDSCGICDLCKDGLQHLCLQRVLTYR
jgi:D-arabinose 1-dehydrogenase-like Zn-dependent alcohol dehydrogenase